jgi:hypothetical protein
MENRIGQKETGALGWIPGAGLFSFKQTFPPKKGLTQCRFIPEAKGNFNRNFISAVTAESLFGGCRDI